MSELPPDTPSVCRDTQIQQEDTDIPEIPKFDDLTPLNFYGYGLGHFFNDLTASYWFNFAIYYLVTVVGTKAAGFAFLMGQLTDALTTPLAGYAADNIKTRFGQRTFWYAVGFLICVVSFPMIFRNIGTSGSETSQYLYYGGFASLFNFGWAFGQISHLSIVPAVTCSKLRRERLNNLRNTFSYAANFLFLGLLSILFAIVPDYSLYFFEMAVLVVLLGSITSLFFLSVTSENNLTESCHTRRANLINQLPEQLRESERQQRNNFRWSFWFRQWRFYLFGLAYICARLSVNMMATLLPFYIKAKGDTKYTTYIILLLYLCSIITSANTSRLSLKLGRNRSLAIGVGFSLLASFVMYINPASLLPMLMAAAFVGVSQAIIINSVINFICEVIGARSEKGASVFGIYSFVDKIVTGLAVYFATLPANISNSTKLELTILLVPPSLGILSCLWVCLTRVRPKAGGDVLQEQVARSNPRANRILQELVM